MSHDHSHSAIGPGSHGNAFAIGVTLNLAFVVIEAVFGILGGSLALLADAGHNLSDVLGLLLAWAAIWLAKRPPSPRRTYGLRRSSILAALFNAILLLIAVGAIAWEAVGRVFHPASVSGGTVVIVAAIGVAVNTATALLFLSGRERDLNIRGAFLHMAADAAVSLGVVVAGVFISVSGWTWLDPVISLAIAAVISVGTWDLFRQSVNMSMDAVPEGIDVASVRGYLAGLAGVVEVHDLHIWGMSTTETALTAHLIKPDAKIDDAWLAQVARELHERFRIDHATIQVEHGQTTQRCKLAPEDVV
jgi:cobalt-zinc-cadmium efflux system protein